MGGNLLSVSFPASPSWLGTWPDWERKGLVVIYTQWNGFSFLDA